ncbi:MAG: GNAT family N-acetyltransferase [Lachnospiraceae bacterium]|nr:GNAT family N-acetyltransferase [Lachnospiraceae bacterium]
MKIVRIERHNREIFKYMLFEPEQALTLSPERFGVLDGDTPCGSVIYSVTEDRIRLHSFFVQWEYRRKGVGSAMMSHLIRLGKEKGAMFITANFFHIQEAMVQFLLSFGFIITDEPGIYFFSLEDALQSQTVWKYLFERTYPDICRSFFELSEKERKAVTEYLAKGGYPVLRTKEPGFQYYLSFCVFGKKGEVKSVLLTFGFDSSIIIDYMMGSGRDNTSMLLLFRRLLEALSSIPDCRKFRIIFQAENEGAVSLAEKLLEESLFEADFVCHAVRELF